MFQRQRRVGPDRFSLAYLLLGTGETQQVEQATPTRALPVFSALLKLTQEERDGLAAANATMRFPKAWAPLN